MALIPLFFLCAFIIYFLIEKTLIPLLDASQWLVLFGAVGFLSLYLVKDKMRLDLTDGLILSIFGIAPLLMATMLTVNFYFSTPFQETFRVADSEQWNGVTVIHLEGHAYEDFYRIRSFSQNDVPRSSTITYQFGQGPLGWQVMRGNSWEDE